MDFDKDLQDEFWCFNPEHPVNPVKKSLFKSEIGFQMETDYFQMETNFGNNK